MCVVLYLEAVAGWLKQSQLKLNPSKIVVLCLGWEETRIGIQLPALDRVLLTPAPTAKSLGLTFRCFDRHGSPNPKCCQIWFFFCLCQIRQLIPYLSPWPSHSDLCNFYLQAGLLQLTLCRTTLEIELETSAGPECSNMGSNRNTSKSTYAPIKYQLKFKSLLLIFKHTFRTVFPGMSPQKHCVWLIKICWLSLALRMSV